jgi:hypothetical protein
MKTNILTTLSLLAFLFIGSESFAKNSFKGFVMTNDNEKIVGEIFVISPTVNELKVKFIDEAGNSKTYQAKDLQSYSFEVPKYNKATSSYETEMITYVRKTVQDAPVRMGSKEILIERQVSGDIQVYNQYIEVDEKIGGTIGHFFYVEKPDGSLSFTKITEGNYKEVMKAATAQFPELSNKVGTSGFGYKYIVKIAQIYNQHLSREISSMAN